MNLFHFSNFNFATMFVREEMKLNRFRDVRIPRNSEYFARAGAAVLPPSQFTNDEQAVMPQSKIQSIVEMEAYDKMKQEEENSKTE
jgi:hypothetical protein